MNDTGGVLVMDDYAHHPTEVTATLAAGRQGFPAARLVAVFQPHLYSRKAPFGAPYPPMPPSSPLFTNPPLFPFPLAPPPPLVRQLGADRRGVGRHYMSTV